MKKNTLIRLITAITATAILSTTTFAHTYTVKEGWNLLGATENISSLKKFSENGSIIWTYDEAWIEIDLNSDSSIDKGYGFWFKASSGSDINVSINSYDIVFGETINIDNGKLIVKFEDITDSRCPDGAQCIIAGDVNLQLGVTGLLEIYEMQSFKLNETKSNTQGYGITLNSVIPYPSIGEDINKSKYIATINIINPNK